MTKTNRRYFIKTSLLAAALMPMSVITKVIGAERASTPQESAGPFYPIAPQKDKDFDLTQVA